MNGYPLHVVGNKNVLASGCVEPQKKSVHLTDVQFDKSVCNKSLVNSGAHFKSKIVDKDNDVQHKLQQYTTRYVYDRKYRWGDIESLLVRPCQQSFKVFKATVSDRASRSYASVVKWSVP